MTRHAPLWLQAGVYPAATDRDLLGFLFPNASASGMAVSATSGMVVSIAAGRCTIPTGNQTGSVLCSSDAAETVTLAAAPASGSNRIDLVIVQVRGNDLDGGQNNDFIFSVVTGSAAASPVAPAVPANAIALASIYVAGGSASVVAGNITDARPGPMRDWATAWGYEGREVVNAQVFNMTVSGTWYDLPLITIGPWTPVANRLFVASFTGAFANNTTGLASLRVVNQATVQLPNALSTFWGGSASVAQWPQGVRSTAFSLPATPVTHRVQFQCGSTDMRVNASVPMIFNITDVGPVPGTRGPAG